jgi:hypothetical protein
LLTADSRRFPQIFEEKAEKAEAVGGLGRWYCARRAKTLQRKMNDPRRPAAEEKRFNRRLAQIFADF